MSNDEREVTLDTLVVELKANAETEHEFARRVALVCAELADRSLGNSERRPAPRFDRAQGCERLTPCIIGSRSHLPTFMTQKQDRPDVDRLRSAIRSVIVAARAEAAAFQKAADECDDDSMKALRETHLQELNAVQALLASLELFERRVLSK